MEKKFEEVLNRFKESLLALDKSIVETKTRYFQNEDLAIEIYRERKEQEMWET